MLDSTTAIEVVTKGPNIALCCIALLFLTWLYYKIKDLIYGDE